MKNIYFILSAGIICLFLGLAGTILAEDISATATTDATIDETVVAQDLELKEQTLLPDSPFYFLKNWSRGIQTLFTFDPTKKAELKLKFANEKILEVQKLAQKGVSVETINKAIENYTKEAEKIKETADAIKEKAAQNSETNKFLEKFTKQEALQQKILQKLDTQVPAEVMQKIEEARNAHIQKFEEVMKKLEDRQEKIKENIENALDNSNGSQFQDFKKLQLLKDFQNNTSSADQGLTNTIQKIQEETLQALKDKIQTMSETQQQEFQKYIQNISGDNATKLEMLENLKQEIKKQTTDFKKEINSSINEIKNSIINNIKEEIGQAKNCPMPTALPIDFCKTGRITTEKNDQGCFSFKCVIPADSATPDAALPSSPKKITNCIALWDPVCGKNGRTYSNKCFAEVMGVEVYHKGVCENGSTTSGANCQSSTTGNGTAQCTITQTQCVEGTCKTTTTTNATP